MDVLARLRGEKTSRLVLLHVVVATSFVAWRAIESWPATSPARGASFVTTWLGRGLALILVLSGTLAGVGVVIQTYRLRREFVPWILFAAWIGALVGRGSIDVFDVTYVLLTAVAAAGAFASRRT